MTASCGVASYRPDDDQTSLLVRTDRALYTAKATGRKRVEIAIN
ncbi:diguanylate cyclase [Chloroflexus islandicus]|nr:diguanylate cyclase [Chloroflexus islandicus]